MHFYGTATSGEGHANWANSVSYTQVTDINETIKTLHDQSSLTSLEQLHFKIFYCERHDNADTKLRTRTLLQNYVIADYVANVGST
jgi:hypothetical protein